MSYDYFLQAHIEGDDQVVMTSEVLRIFQPYASEIADNYVDLDFGDAGSCTIFMEVSSPFISGININCPCSAKELVDCLYDVMVLGNFVFFEPDGKNVIVLNKETIGHLPVGMTDSLGEAVVAESRDAFRQLYQVNFS